MAIQYSEIQDALKYGNRNYYVYRLIDPRTSHTLYVGKGCGDRVFQHVSDVKRLVANDEDLESLKQQLIDEITADGKDVIAVIYRRGLTEKEAFEVEAALIDVGTNPGCKLSEIQVEIGKSLASTKLYVQLLRENGIMEHVGSPKTGGYRLL